MPQPSSNICKISITMRQDLLDFVEYYSATHAKESRSAIIQKGLMLLREAELGSAYQEANSEIDYGFEICSGDGLNEKG